MGLFSQGNHIRKKSYVAILISFALAVGMLSTVLVKPVEAKTARLAVISSLDGDVTVKKGGGSKSYDAYEDMSLNEGDTLYTGSDSSVTLNVSNGDSEITLGADAEFNISDLTGGSGGKKSKFRMWAGSMWVKVKSLVGSSDEFEVETPTAVMGVRGTQFFVGVDPASGESKLAVGAGLVAATISAPPTGIAPPPPGNNHTVVHVYPTQQLTVDFREETNDLTVNIEPLDIDAFVKKASSDVIQAIIEDKAAIDKENAEFIDKKKKEIENGTNISDGNSTFVVKSIEELDKVITNLNNLVGNIAKTAVDTKKVDKDTINKVIENANKKIDDPSKKIDLNHVIPLDKTAGIDPDAEKKRIDERQKLEDAKLKQQLEEKRKQDELKTGLAKFLKTLEDNRKAIEEANKKAQEDAKAKAEAELFKQLDDAAKKLFNANKAKIEGTTSPIGGTSSTSTSTTTIITPKVNVSATEPSDGIFTVTVALSDFRGTNSNGTSNEIYGAELHLVYDNSIQPFGEDFIQAGSIFNPITSVDNHRIFTDTDASKSEVVYAAANYGSATPAISVDSAGKTWVTFKFTGNPGETLVIPDGRLILVNKTGIRLSPTITPSSTSDGSIAIIVPGTTPSSTSPSPSPTG